MMGRDAIGIDIGGTQLRAAVVTADGTVQHMVKQPTAHAHADDLRDQLATVRRAFRPDLPVGIAIAGLVNTDGVVQASPNMPNVTFPLTLTGPTSSAPAVVVNDASAAAYGEHLFGAATHARSSVTLTIGTGVGAGLVLDGTLLTGTHGFAGEVGHMLAAHGGAPHTVEDLLSGTAIAANASARFGRSVSVRDVADAAHHNDPVAITVLHDAATVLGDTLANLANLLDVDMFVIGGGAGVGLFALMQPVATATLTRHLLGVTAGRSAPTLAVALLGDAAGVVGAAALAAKRSML